MKNHFRLACVSLAALSSSSLLAQEGGPAAAPAPTPAGYAIDESGCASGGPTAYFFDGGKVLIDDCGDECPFISEGTWSMAELSISATLTTAYVGKGTTLAPGPMAARAVYTDYKADLRPMSKVENYLWQGDDGCAVIRKHDLKSPDARALLKGKWAYQHPEVSARALTAADLDKRDLDELVIMRNEIFAAYGHRFQTEKLATYFAGFPGYRPYYVDVSAFLTATEKANVDLIKAAEAKRKKAKK